MSAGSNTFGKLFRWTSFGESHGSAMGVVIDGCPAGLNFDEELLLKNLAARRPGQKGTTDRQELDSPEILSGIFENKTLGTPIAVIVRNTDQRSSDYQAIKNESRVGHADDVWQGKFGHRDHRGGGRASARETLNWVIAGSFAQMYMKSQCSAVVVKATLSEVGGVVVDGIEDSNLQSRLEKAKNDNDSLGAVLTLQIQKPPAFLGEPVFGKIKSELAQAFFSINACTGVEMGGGFELSRMSGQELHQKSDSPLYGGIRGGISTGEDILFRLAFKPTASINKVAEVGRHDPCVAIRALPIVEAMAWSVLADLQLMKKLNQLNPSF